MTSQYADRREAGRLLAGHLSAYAGRADVTVLGLPRGGVPVAFEVAAALGAPLDVFVVRKLGVPGHEELAMGAVAGGGVRVLNGDVIEELAITEDLIDQVATREQRELERRARAFRGDAPELALADRIVILVDDGLATGSTMKAAVQAVRQLGPAKIVVAVPVGPPSMCREIGEQADEVICPQMPRWFSAVGQWYADFTQTTDDEVVALLQRARGDAPAQRPPS